VILSIDGRKVVAPDDLARIISAHQPGDRVTFENLHEGDRESVEVTLGRRPNDG
jgi:S1-C subfamily serine protease